MRADTGQGIPADELPRIFDTFRQVGGPGRASGGGLQKGAELVLALPRE